MTVVVGQPVLSAVSIVVSIGTRDPVGTVGKTAPVVAPGGDSPDVVRVVVGGDEEVVESWL